MSLLTRVANVFRGETLRNDIEEELEAHVAHAVEEGRSEAEARRALGATLRQREASYAIRVQGRLDALRADVIFGWRQLKRNRVSSAAAIVSLALAMGACVGAFRLVDAMLWRPLPIAHPERLYGLSRQGIGSDGKWGSFESWSYPEVAEMQKAIGGDADLIGVSFADRAEISYATEKEIEKATVIHVSARMFEAFGLRPAVGRQFTGADDQVAGKAPYAVLSDDYWMRRFRRDPGVIGKTLHFQNGIYEIVGVAQKGFTGTTPATVADIFLPASMHLGFNRPNFAHFRVMAVLHEGEDPTALREKLAAAARRFDEKTMGTNTAIPAPMLKSLLSREVALSPASTGLSGFREQYRRALLTLGVLAAMVLLIACFNVANLMSAQAAGRTKEMALRVSIGAGRSRLVQMVLVESAMMAALAAAAGSVLAWWSAPFVVHMMDRPDVPIQLMLPADTRVIAFGIALTFGVMLLFGLGPALRASRVQPASVLKGGDAKRNRSGWMHGMIGAQVAFCFVVIFVAGLFVSTFRQLSALPLGFDKSRLLLLEVTGRDGIEDAAWGNVMDHLRSTPGVENVGMSSWPLLSESTWTYPISVHGSPLSTQTVDFLLISPAWLKTMRIELVDGRDFRDGDFFFEKAVVNQTFAKAFFGGNALGQVFETREDRGDRKRLQVVGVVRDAVYGSVREPMSPVVYMPFFPRPTPNVTEAKGPPPPAGLVPHFTFAVKTAAQDPRALAAVMRKEVPNAREDMRVVNVQTQDDVWLIQLARERLLAMLSFFFGGVSLLLASIGLYGVLHYIVLEKRREIGIRLALGARTMDIVRDVMAGISVTAVLGSFAGICVGIGTAKYIASLLYGVEPANPLTLGIPLVVIALTLILAALPAIRRALRVDPVEMLRAE
jgi:putative ABC transport system permease protein